MDFEKRTPPTGMPEGPPESCPEDMVGTPQPTEALACGLAPSPGGAVSRKPVAIVAITQNGTRLALRIQAKIEESICYVPSMHRFALAMGAVAYERVGGILAEIWPKHSALICIMATGIVVRQIAPLLRHKTVDPAVVVLDERGQYAISLVSGHLGGANRLAREVAAITGGRAVITTASDVRNKPAIDLIAREAGLEIENPDMLSPVAAAILEDAPLWIYDPEGRLKADLGDQAGIVWANDGHLRESGSRAEGGVIVSSSDMPSASGGIEPSPLPRVWVSERQPPSGLSCLLLRPRNLVVGVGCNRGAEADEILDLVESVFREAGLSPLSIKTLTSIDLKADEQGLLKAAERLGRPVRFHSREALENITVPNPSEVVAKHIGAPSVCEATAILSAGGGSLVLPKRKTPNVTMAVARVGSPS